MSKPLNIPKVIYLQISDDIDDYEVGQIDMAKHDDLDGISWCNDRIFRRDIKYILAKPKRKKGKGGK